MQIDTNERVRVHKNLNTGQWVIRKNIAGKGWRVFSNQIESVCLISATPIVSEKGAERIKSKGHREVIACIEGNFAGYDIEERETGESIHYNPFRNFRFTYQTGDIWEGSDIAIFGPQGSNFKEGIF